MQLIRVNTILSHGFNPTLYESNPENTVPEADALSTRPFLLVFDFLPPSEQVIIGKCAVDILTIENAILLLD